MMRSPFSKDRTWVSTDVGRAPPWMRAPSPSLSLWLRTVLPHSPSLSQQPSRTRTVAGLLFFAFNHGVGVFAPVLFFSWRRLGLHFLLYCASGMGITYSYHRQLAHRSFKSKKCARPLILTRALDLAPALKPTPKPNPMYQVARAPPKPNLTYQVARVPRCLVRYAGNAGSGSIV